MEHVLLLLLFSQGKRKSHLSEKLSLRPMLLLLSLFQVWRIYILGEKKASTMPILWLLLLSQGQIKSYLGEKLSTVPMLLLLLLLLSLVSGRRPGRREANSGLNTCQITVRTVLLTLAQKTRHQSPRSPQAKGTRR
jgi:hypothetical protein